MKKTKFKKFKDKFDKFSSDVKDKVDNFTTETNVSSIKLKYKSKSLLDKSKEFLKGYDSLEGSFLLPEDSDDIQSSLSKMLSDEREKDTEEVQWESISTYKHIKEKKILGSQKYWVYEFSNMFNNLLEFHDMEEILTNLKNPRDMRALIFIRVFKKIEKFSKES